MEKSVKLQTHFCHRLYVLLIAFIIFTLVLRSSTAIEVINEIFPYVHMLVRVLIFSHKLANRQTASIAHEYIIVINKQRVHIW